MKLMRKGNRTDSEKHSHIARERVSKTTIRVQTPQKNAETIGIPQ